MPDHHLHDSAARLGAIKALRFAPRKLWQRWEGSMDAVVRDVRYAVRALKRSPAFTTAVVITLALGIGASTTMFSLTDALLFRSIRVHRPDRLVRLSSVGVENRDDGILGATVDRISQTNLFAGLCGFFPPGVTIEFAGRTMPVIANIVTGDCFRTLGVRPALGRLLSRDDDRPGAPNVAVLSYDEWQRNFGGNAATLGQAINIEGVLFSVVGVTEAGFSGLRVGFPARIFYTFNANVGTGPGHSPPANTSMQVLARLRPDLSADATTIQLRTRWSSLLQDSIPPQVIGVARERYLSRRLAVEDASTGMDFGLRRRFRTPLVVLLATSGAVLLISCINVGNLLLARSAVRRREMLVRSAIGASRWQLMRGAAAESVVMLTVAVVVGFIVARWLARFLVALYGEATLGFNFDVGIDNRLLMYAAILGAVAFAAFAIAPVWVGSGDVDAISLNVASTRLKGTHSRLRSVTVVAQVALTIVVVTTGSLFVAALAHLRSIPLGLSSDRVITVQLAAVPGGYQRGFDGRTYYGSLLSKIESIPSIQSAALSQVLPLSGSPGPVRVTVPDLNVEVDAVTALVSDAFFSTLQIPMVAGSSFSRSAGRAVPRTAIVSESLRAALFGADAGLHRMVRSGPANQNLQIIGVVRDAMIYGPRQSTPRVVYVNYWEASSATQSYPGLIVRLRGDAMSTFGRIEDAVHSFGREYVLQARSLPAVRDVALTQERLLAVVSTVFATVGLTLAAVGLYGLMSFAVAQRTGEIAIRKALGADNWAIARLISSEVTRLVVVGGLIGAAAASAAARLAHAVIVDKNLSIGFSPVVIALALLLLVAGAAVWVPTRRAANVDPMVALRAE